MTHTTDQERAEFEKAWRERPIYMGGVHQKEVAYIWWMQAARRAPAVPVPGFNHPAKRKLELLTGEGATITGYAFQSEGRRGSIDCHGFVAWFPEPAAAPQPPDAFQTEGGCPVSNAETVAIAALEKVLRAVQRHLPPERIGERETIAEIISIVDPWPLGKPPAPWKDHMTAELVGKLTDVARQFHGTQQLRERIAGLVRPVCERIKQLGDDRMPEGDMGNPISASAPAQLPEPVAAESRFTTFAGNRWRCCTVEHARAFGADKGYEVRYLYTEQQVRDLLAASKVERKPLTHEIITETALQAGAAKFYPEKQRVIEQNYVVSAGFLQRFAVALQEQST